MARIATPKDEKTLREMWKICFGDTDAFISWFFAERFYPDLSVVHEYEGRIVSALHGYPLHLRVGEGIVPASMLAGVSTLPGCEGKGYMRENILFYMQLVRASGAAVSFQTPVNMPTFISRGFLPNNRTRFLTHESATASAVGGIIEQSMYTGLSPLHTCYVRSTEHYSGIVSRSLADQYHKFRDYASDGAKCIASFSETHCNAYAVYYDQGEKIHAEEVIARDEQGYDKLLKALAHIANGRKLLAKLPPDTKCTLNGAQTQTRHKGALAIADVSKLLRACVGDASIRIEVTDRNVPQNQGIWDGMGERCENPHLKIDAGHLGQLLTGYASMHELESEKHLARLHDDGALNALASITHKRECFVVDEY